MEIGTSIPVVVLNWNGIDDTEQCVQHLLQQSFRSLKIYLADNGSDENNVHRLELIKIKNPEIELILFEENLGFTKAHNRVIEVILALDPCPKYILLLNNDAFAHVDWAKELMMVASSENADLVASKMINYFERNELDNVGHRLLNTAEIIPEGTGDFPEQFAKINENIGPCAGAALYSTAMLEEVGLFDEYFETGYEDAEIGVRASVVGYKSVLAPNAIVHHKISRSVSKIRDFNYVLKTQLNIFYSYFKLMPRGVILINFPFLLLKYGIVLILNLLFGRWFFFRVMRTAIWKSLTSERNVIMNARKDFHQNHTTISTWKILKKMEFFLWFDIKRFFKHMIRGEKTQFEKISQHS